MTSDLAPHQFPYSSLNLVSSTCSFKISVGVIKVVPDIDSHAYLCTRSQTGSGFRVWATVQHAFQFYADGAPESAPLRALPTA
jgi:hypothetical protein